MASEVNWRPIAWYLALAFALAWLASMPLYVSGEGLAYGFFTPVALAMMVTPMIAAIFTVVWIEKYPLVRRDGKPSAWDVLGVSIRRPYGRLTKYFLIAWLGMLVLVFLALVTSSLLGSYRFDLQNFSGLRELLLQQSLLAGQPLPEGVTIHNVVFAQVVSVVFFSLLNLLPALGEEIGWRGYLMPRLATHSPALAIIGGGIAWGLWHLPLLVLGYNYPTVGLVLSAGLMVGMCTLVGALLFWVRLRANSVWPAAIGHGALNAGAGLAFVFAQAPLAAINTATATVMGVCGWIIPALLVAALWVKGGFSRENLAALDR